MSHYFGAAATGGLPLQSSDYRDYYVSKTGNDATGDGSVGNPFLTLAKAQEVAFQYIGNIRINLGPGSYNEQWVTPAEAVGSVTIRGDLVTPSNVEIDGTGFTTTIGHGGYFDVLNGLFSLKCNAELILEGIKVSNGVVGVWIDDQKFTHKYCEFDGQLVYAGAAFNQANWVAQSDANGDTTFTASSASVGIIGANNASFTFDQAYDIDGFTKGVEMQDSCKVEFVDPNNFSITLADTAGAVGVDIAQGSTMNGDANIVVYGNAARTDDRALYIHGNSACSMAQFIAGTFTAEDCAVGVDLANRGLLEAYTHNFVYTNCTVDVRVDSTSAYQHDNDLDASKFEFKNEVDLVDGRDARAFYFNRYYGI